MIYLKAFLLCQLIAMPLAILIGWLIRDNDDPSLQCQCEECRQHKGEN